MTGIYQHTLDAKGRLFIPAKLREELGDVFYVTISMDPCLALYSREAWQDVSDRVSAMSLVDQRKMRALYAYAAKVELDAQGRILLPQNLREHAKLMKNVTVVGVNNHAELWNSDVWDTTCANESSPENIAAVMEELHF